MGARSRRVNLFQEEWGGRDVPPPASLGECWKQGAVIRVGLWSSALLIACICYDGLVPKPYWHNIFWIAPRCGPGGRRQWTGPSVA